MAKRAGATKSAPKKATSVQPAAKASRPRYKMKVEDDVYVAMPDGVRIACRIYRPGDALSVARLVGVGTISLRAATAHIKNALI